MHSTAVSLATLRIKMLKRSRVNQKWKKTKDHEQLWNDSKTTQTLLVTTGKNNNNNNNKKKTFLKCSTAEGMLSTSSSHFASSMWIRQRNCICKLHTSITSRNGSRTEPELNPRFRKNQTELELICWKTCRARTEPSPQTWRSWTETEPHGMGSGSCRFGNVVG